MALPSQHRLRHHHDFSRVYRLGRRQSSPHLVLRSLCLVDVVPTASAGVCTSPELPLTLTPPASVSREADLPVVPTTRAISLPRLNAVVPPGQQAQGGDAAIAAAQLPPGGSAMPASHGGVTAAEPDRFNRQIPPTQIGFTVSTKVSKRAVVRNRIKRRLRAAVRSLLPRILPGWLVVISVRPGRSECGYAEFLQELEQLLSAAEVLDHGH